MWTPYQIHHLQVVSHVQFTVCLICDCLAFPLQSCSIGWKPIGVVCFLVSLTWRVLFLLLPTKCECDSDVKEPTTYAYFYKSHNVSLWVDVFHWYWYEIKTNRILWMELSGFPWTFTEEAFLFPFVCSPLLSQMRWPWVLGFVPGLTTLWHFSKDTQMSNKFYMLSLTNH